MAANPCIVIAGTTGSGKSTTLSRILADMIRPQDACLYPEEEAFESKTYRRRSRLLSFEDPAEFFYADPKGDPSLRSQIAMAMAGRKPSAIVFGSPSQGAQDAPPHGDER